jgi:3-hydroxy acid dehydrogenase/malonic semialdehyde reductase
MSYSMSQVAMIVGASGGVGSACVSSLAQAGCTVIGAARRVQRIREQLSQLEKPEMPHEAFELDVTSRSHIEMLVAKLLSRSKMPSILVYCVGVSRFGLLGEQGDDAWQQTFAVNVRGAFDVCAAFVPHMREGNRIIIVGSTAGLQPFEGGTIYCASKAALHAFAIALRKELRPRKISVSLVIPGSIATEFWRGSRPDFDKLLTADLIGQLIAATAMAPTGSEISEIVVRPLQES